MEYLRISLYEKLWNTDKPGDVNEKVTATAVRNDLILNVFSFFSFTKCDCRISRKLRILM